MKMKTIAILTAAIIMTGCQTIPMTQHNAEVITRGLNNISDGYRRQQERQQERRFNCHSYRNGNHVTTQCY
jgi:starvation-inducible outer membrane lipoprotein